MWNMNDVSPSEYYLHVSSQGLCCACHREKMSPRASQKGPAKDQSKTLCRWASSDELCCLLLACRAELGRGAQSRKREAGHTEGVERLGRKQADKGS